MAHTIAPHGVQAGVAEQDLPVGARCWIPLKNGSNIFVGRPKKFDHNFRIFGYFRHRGHDGTQTKDLRFVNSIGMCRSCFLFPERTGVVLPG
jgi:hypothetical protein